MFVTKKHIPQETRAGRARVIFQNVCAESNWRTLVAGARSIPAARCSKWYFWTAGTLPILLVIKQLVSRAP